MAMKKKSKARGSSQPKSPATGKLHKLRVPRGVFPQCQGDVVWLKWEYVEGRGRGGDHPALVISNDSFNSSHAWGILALITTDFAVPLDLGEYLIKDLTLAGLSRASAVVPVIESAEWGRMKKWGELSPYEFKQAVAKLREVWPI